MTCPVAGNVQLQATLGRKYATYLPDLVQHFVIKKCHLLVVVAVLAGACLLPRSSPATEHHECG